MDKQIEEEDVRRKERESDRKQGRKSEANRAGMSRSSTGVRRDAGLVRRVERKLTASGISLLILTAETTN